LPRPACGRPNAAGAARPDAGQTIRITRAYIRAASRASRNRHFSQALRPEPIQIRNAAHCNKRRPRVYRPVSFRICRPLPRFFGSYGWNQTVASYISGSLKRLLRGSTVFRKSFLFPGHAAGPNPRQGTTAHHSERSAAFPGRQNGPVTGMTSSHGQDRCRNRGRVER
jgi:hypothetical protein